MRSFQQASSAIALGAIALLTAASSASARVESAAPDGFHLRIDATLNAPKGAAYAALGRIDRWWSDAHTYSGAAANMRMPLRAGACFCETWRGGSVEHGRVVLAIPDQTLRFEGALGPLQSMGVNAVMTIQLERESDATTRLVATYQVSGRADQNLAELAPAVDQVLVDQFARLARYTETGVP